MEQPSKRSNSQIQNFINRIIDGNLKKEETHSPSTSNAFVDDITKMICLIVKRYKDLKL